jgi:hypothetical protein
MAAYPYRLPRKYRRYRRRSRTDPKQLAIGIAVAVIAAGALSHPGAVTSAVHHSEGALPAAVPVTSSSGTAFIKAVLADMGAPATTADIDSLRAWFPHEGTAAEHNPMASTMDAPGATVFNYDNVRNYPTAAEGAEETARTLDDGRYPLIVAALDSGRGLCGDPALAGEFLTWSGGGYSSVC